VTALRREKWQLKHLVADLSLRNVVFKKTVGGSDSELDDL